MAVLPGAISTYSTPARRKNRSRQRRLNNFFYSLYERYSDIHHLRFLDDWSANGGPAIDYATQHDIALGRVRLEDYRLALIGNH